MINTIARLGIMGFLGCVVVLAVVGLAVYGFVERPDHDLTSQLVVVLAMGTGGVLMAVASYFKQEEKRDYVNLESINIPAEPPIDIYEPSRARATEDEGMHRASRYTQIASLCVGIGKGSPLGKEANDVASMCLAKAKEALDPSDEEVQ